MDTAPPPDVDIPDGFPPGSQQLDCLLAALKAALATNGEHRLFRSGKLAGLFPNKAGISAEAALFATRHGLLELIRTETRGKIVTEWVKATPIAVAFVHEHDSPKSVLRELKDVLDSTRAGVPVWMIEAKAEVADLANRFEERASAMLARLDDLAVRVEAALRRAEIASPAIAEPVSRVVPWAVEMLEYLDKRLESGRTGACPLPELFKVVRVSAPEISLPDFQDGLRRLHDVRAVRLTKAEIDEPEYAIVIDGQLMYAAMR